MRIQTENASSNGVYKNGAISIPKKGRVIVEEDVGELDKFDLQSYMSSAMTNRASRAIKPSDKQKREQLVAAFVKESEELFALSEKYQEDFVARGNQALYDLLGSVYSLGLRIEQSDNCNEIVRHIQTKLKAEHDIKIGSSASTMSTVVQYVIRSDKRTCTRYAKVLEVAMSEDLSPEELPAYIARRGGVSQIQQVESEAIAKKQGAKQSSERLALLREFYKYYAYQNIFQEIDYDQAVTHHNADNTRGSETSQFVFLMAVEDPHKQGQFKILSAHDLGKTFEDVVFRYLTKTAPSSLHVLEAGLRNLQKKMLNDDLPPKLQEHLKAQLDKPQRYSEQKTIEVQAKEV